MELIAVFSNTLGSGQAQCPIAVQTLKLLILCSRYRWQFIKVFLNKEEKKNKDNNKKPQTTHNQEAECMQLFKDQQLLVSAIYW